VNLAEGAAAWRDVAGRAEAGLARECCEAAARDYLAVLRAVTPKRTGKLMESETIDAVTGGGTHAMAVIGPHTVYARFRNYGGVISVKHAKVLTDGQTFFGKSVRQSGSHYMEKAEAASAGPIAEACREVVARFFTI
jgi:phage gpG-like protein